MMIGMLLLPALTAAVLVLVAAVAVRYLLSKKDRKGGSEVAVHNAAHAGKQGAWSPSSAIPPQIRPGRTRR